MTAPQPIGISSPSLSASTFSDVVSSYRRAQTFLSTSNITTADVFPEYFRQQEEQTDIRNDDDLHEIPEANGDLATPRAVDTNDPLWDDTLRSSELRPYPVTHEGTPLLRNISSQQDLSRPLSRRPSARQDFRASIDTKPSEYYFEPGKSTYKQTLFNSIAILLGIGMLSEPLAFAYAGWIPGTILIVLYGYMACYTAKILAHIIADDPSLRTYADIGYKAFGPKSTILTGVLFCLEIFAVSVVLITLYADSLHLVVPTLLANQYKIVGLAIIIPTVFLPLSVLSYASVLGILSTILIIICIGFDGFIKRKAPGSLWEPEATSLVVTNARTLGVAFGLFMAGFSGHVVMPSLARDMQNPHEFDSMINWAFAVTTAIYGMIGAIGYLMFGNHVSEEISRNILETPGYPSFLNTLTVWMLVIAPLSKFALSTRPLNLTIEIWLGIDNPGNRPAVPSRPPSPATRSATTLATSPRFTTRPVLLIFERICLALLAVAVSILIPEFSTMMAFLGSFAAFVLCIIGPVSAKVAIKRKCSWFDAILLALSILFATWGTIAAFTESV